MSHAFRRMQHVLRLALVCLVVVASAACSTVTTREGMTPAPIAVVASPRSERVALLVSGEPRGIAVENFKLALADSIATSKLFAGVGEDPAFLIEVQIQDVTQPMFGAGFTVSMRSIWKAFRIASREKVWEAQVDATYEGGAMEGGLVGANRLRVATERAARANIQLGIEKLAGANLTP